MADPPPTVNLLREQFISSQTLLLTSTLAPSAAFQAANKQAEHALPARLAETIAQNIDNQLQLHLKRVLAPQANRAVAEQISDRYTSDVDRRLEREALSEDAIGREVDLADQKVIASLPETWTQEKDIAENPLEAKRYADAVQRLLTLSEQREDLENRVDRLRRMKATINPLQTTSGGVGVQENLATRNSEVEKELERMRILLARVAGRVGTLPDAVAGDEQAVEPFKVARKREIDEFLADTKVFPGS